MSDWVTIKKDGLPDFGSLKEFVWYQPPHRGEGSQNTLSERIVTDRYEPIGLRPTTHWKDVYPLPPITPDTPPKEVEHD